MEHKERIFRILLFILAFAILAAPAMYAGATGNHFSELGSKLIVSASHLSLIGALLIGLNRNPKSKHAKIGAISGLTILLIQHWL